MKFNIGDIVRFKGPNGSTAKIIGIDNSLKDNIKLEGFNLMVPDNMLELVKDDKMKLKDTVHEIKSNILDLEKLKAKTEFYSSLLGAVSDAGGSSDWITEETTVKELAESLAINAVRFYHIKSGPTVKEPTKFGPGPKQLFEPIGGEIVFR